MKIVSIKEIAEYLGLSRNTVSKVLNGKPGVLPETEEKIIRAAQQLGYNKLSSELLQKLEPTAPTQPPAQPGGQIVLLTNGENVNSFWSGIISGVYSALSGSGYSLIYSEIRPGQHHLLPEILYEGKVDGLIVTDLYDLEIWKAIRKTGIPTVFLDSPVNVRDEYVGGDIVLTEGIISVKEITDRLIADGAKKLAFVGDITYCQTLFDRWCGFYQAVVEAGLQPEKRFLFTASPDRFYGQKTIHDVVESMTELPDAIVCANDAIARMIIRELKARNIQVPQQVCVAGFDNSPGDPIVTSVAVDYPELSKRLVRQLFWRMQEKRASREIVRIRTEVVYRESTQKAGR